jgi:hypothetical protein
MMLRVLLALMLATGATAAAAELGGPGWRLDPGDRLRPAGVVNGWTVLRDAQAPAGAEEYGLLLLRVQRPVPPAQRPGHLEATLRHLRPFRLTGLPRAEAVRHAAGLPAAVLETRALGAGTGTPLVLRAEAIYGPDRSYLLIASAPEAEWPGLEEAMLAAAASFRPLDRR